MATKPTGADLNLSWGESASADVLEPSIAKQGIGFQEAERPANNYFNWFTRTTARWLAYLRDIEASALVWTALQTFSAALVANGAAGNDEAAVLSSTVVVTTRRLLWVMGGGNARKIRFYRTSTGTFEVTFNAWWRVSDSKWVADSATIGSRLDAARLVLADVGGSVWRPSTAVGTSRWNDSDWEKLFSGPDNGRLVFCSTGTGAGASNPPSTEALINTLCAKMLPKAWGSVTMISGTPLVVDGANVAGVSHPTSTILRVTLATPMDDVNFAVLANSNNLGSANAEYCITMSHSKDGGAGGCAMFDIICPGITLNTGSHRIGFVVFGKQTS